jgi:hypothetical protein
MVRVRKHDGIDVHMEMPQIVVSVCIAHDILLCRGVHRQQLGCICTVCLQLGSAFAGQQQGAGTSAVARVGVSLGSTDASQDELGATHPAKEGDATHADSLVCWGQATAILRTSYKPGMQPKQVGSKSSI